MQDQFFYFIIGSSYEFDLGFYDLREEEVFLFGEEFSLTLAGGLAVEMAVVKGNGDGESGRDLVLADVLVQEGCVERCGNFCFWQFYVFAVQYCGDVLGYF